MKDLITLSNYLRVWMWMIVAINFLVGGLIVASLTVTNKTIIIQTTLMLLFIYVIFKTFKLRKELFVE